MTEDPVIDLMNQLVAAYDELAKAQKQSGHEAVQRMRAVTTLRELLRVTEPTTPQGAAFHLREAASLLLHSHLCYLGEPLREIANHLSIGHRDLRDLLELRDIMEMIAGGPCGSPGGEAAQLIDAALKGATRPVVIVDQPKPRGRQTPRMMDGPLPPPPQHG